MANIIAHNLDAAVAILHIRKINYHKKLTLTAWSPSLKRLVLRLL
ncbi:hypothetical protein [Grimontia hollisae]|nr:hypothetical protein [Grimontia hollisae]